MKRIAIIVGHSYQAQGAEHPSGTTEFEFNKKLAYLLLDELLELDTQPILVFRNSLTDLPELVNSTGADIAVSLHANAFNTQTSGSETLYWHTSKKGKQLAHKLQAAVVDALGLRDRGIKAVTEKENGGYLLRHTSMPAVILEPFFIDGDDFYTAERYINLLAEELANAIAV